MNRREYHTAEWGLEVRTVDPAVLGLCFRAFGLQSSLRARGCSGFAILLNFVRISTIYQGNLL